MTSEIRQLLDQEPASLAKAMSIVSRLDRETPGWPIIKIAILRNYTVEPMVPWLKWAIYRCGLRPDIRLGEYDNLQQECMGTPGPIDEFEPDITVFAIRLHVFNPALILNFNSLKPGDIASLQESAISRLSALVQSYRQRSKSLIIVNNFEPVAESANGILDDQRIDGQQSVIHAMNQDLIRALAPVNSAYVVDLAAVMASVGLKHALDDRHWQIARNPYSSELLKKLSERYSRYARALKGKTKKCLVLDCDNTLWGGVIGEDGMSGIDLGPTNPGSSYLDFQAGILDLYHRGVLLAICSKNNEADAMEVFEKHPDSLLRPNHFVARRINWQDKAGNIREIAQELNIGLDSLVFMDDNPFECEQVRAEVPEVMTVNLPKGEPATFRSTLLSLGVFDTLTISEEDRQRSQMYLQNKERVNLERNASSLEDYLQSLEMVFTMEPANDYSIPRIAQLTQKTNQFNLSTKRYSEEDIARLARNEGTLVYSFSLKDRFGDNGIIGVAILNTEAGRAELDTFLMSCRVIGRGVEDAALSIVAEDAVKMGFDRLYAQYIPTEKNVLVKAFLPDRGFTADADGVSYMIDLMSASLVRPAWFAAPELRQELNTNG